jgi:hypothetical protein
MGPMYKLGATVPLLMVAVFVGSDADARFENLVEKGGRGGCCMVFIGLFVFLVREPLMSVSASWKGKLALTGSMARTI